MFFELISLIIEACATILVAACLFRFYLHYLKINFAPASGNPFSHFLFPLTNWLIKPLNKVIPLVGRIDLSSLLASYLLVMTKIVILVGLSDGIFLDKQIPVIALFNLFDLALSGFIGLLLVYALFSWTKTYSPTQELFDEMIEPLLRPFRKVSPTISGVDVSALILMLLIQMMKVLLSHAQIFILRLI
jgi:YggT family protein